MKKILLLSTNCISLILAMNKDEQVSYKNSVNSALSHIERGTQHYLNKEDDKALFHFYEVVKSGTPLEQAQGFIQISDIKRLTGKTEEAKELLERALALNPTHKPTLALAYCTKALLEKNPSDKETWAKKCLENADSHQIGSQAACNYMLGKLNKQKNPEQAKYYFNEVLTVASHDHFREWAEKSKKQLKAYPWDNHTHN